MKTLLIIGLILNFIGGLLLVVNSFVTKDEAVNIGVARWAGDTKEENLKLPLVQSLLKQSTSAKWGTILLTIGFGIQLYVTVKQ